MSRLISSAAILTGSRLTNYGVLLLSPLLLVRILDLHAYGQYQEFMLYAMFLASICSFGVDSSITYFLSRNGDREREILTQTSFIVLCISSAVLMVVLLFRPLLLQLTSFDFAIPLVLQVFCFVNLNWIENYWITIKRVDLVVYYSTARLTLRLAVIVLVAYATRSVWATIWAAAAAEGVRLAFVAAYLWRNNLLTGTIDRSRLQEQLRFAAPVGVAGLLQTGDQSAGRFIISTALGPAALGYYSVAAYMLPVIGLIRTSPSDVLFPELVRAQHDPDSMLDLWRRSTLLFCALLFPLAVVLAYYSELTVTTLFTATFLPAVPVFQIYLFWVLRRCFSFDELLRTKGQTSYMIVGSALALCGNVALSVMLYRALGLIGPAIAFVVSQVIAEIYYARRVKLAFKVRHQQLLNWGGMLGVVAACVIASPCLIAADYLPIHPIVRAVAASVTFVGLVWLLAYHFGVDDIGRIARLGSNLVRNRR